MKADTVDLAAVFGPPIHFVVPLYQRPYVWTREDQWEPLWEDVRAVADRQLDVVPSNDAIPHFLGAVVLEQSLTQVGMIGSRTIIDGQQRLTTLQLLIAAARSVASECGLDGPRKMFEKLLLNDEFLVHRHGDEYKVFPTKRDEPAFREALADGIVASSGSHRMHEAYRFFRHAIREWARDGTDGDSIGFGPRLEALSTAVWKRLVLVTIDLDPGDNAQIIFETLNARGTPLLAADLIKNHLFETAIVQGSDIEELFATLWAGLDTDWWRAEVQQGRLTRPRLDIYLNHWLAMSTGTEVVSHQLFKEFKRYLAAGDKQAAHVLEDVARYGRVYERFETEPLTTDLGQFLYRLRTMEVTTAYPALLWLLGPDGLPESERPAALGAIESWLVRRMVTRQTTKNYNNVFLTMLNTVREAALARGARPTARDVVDYLACLRGESQFWPSAGDVRSALTTLPVYSVFRAPRLRMLLEAFEQGMYSELTERVIIQTNLTIEHVLPQEWQTHWPLPEGADAFQARLDRDAAKHRLGNLTLVTGKLNPTLSNAEWQHKREMLRERSVMRISADIRAAETWDEAAIANRGERLASTAIRVWPRPDDADAVTGETGRTQPANRAEQLIGPPDPEAPDAFSSVLAIADEVGVGSELRLMIETIRKLGLHPRPDRYSVMVSPPADRRMYLFTVWPQWDEGGSFRIWKSPAAFARWIPGVTLQSAHAALGSSEEAGMLLPQDVEALLAAITRLVPAGWATGSFEERKAALLALGIEGLDSVPDGVLQLIDRRAGGDSEVSLKFAAAVSRIEGAALRPQQSQGEPVYFQVRHPGFGQVLAYAHPRPGETRVEYRLPEAHETYGLALARNNPYGIVLTVRDERSLEVGAQLVRDALAVPEVAAVRLRPRSVESEAAAATRELLSRTQPLIAERIARLDPQAITGRLDGGRWERILVRREHWPASVGLTLEWNRSVDPVANRPKIGVFWWADRPTLVAPRTRFVGLAPRAPLQALGYKVPLEGVWPVGARVAADQYWWRDPDGWLAAIVDNLVSAWPLVASPIDEALAGE